MGELPTTYMADKPPSEPCLLPPSRDSAVTPPYPPPQSPRRAHWPRLLPVPRTGRGFLTSGLEDMPFPRPGRFSPAPQPGKLLASPLVSVQMAPSCTLAPIETGLLWLALCLSCSFSSVGASKLINSYSTSESSPRRSHMGPGPVVVTTASPAEYLRHSDTQ